MVTQEIPKLFIKFCPSCEVTTNLVILNVSHCCDYNHYIGNSKSRLCSNISFQKDMEMICGSAHEGTIWW